MSDEQHDFCLVGILITIASMLVFKIYVLDAFDTCCLADVIYTDISKDFDTIDHNILAAKLLNLSFHNPI